MSKCRTQPKTMPDECIAYDKEGVRLGLLNPQYGTGDEIAVWMNVEYGFVRHWHLDNGKCRKVEGYVSRFNALRMIADGIILPNEESDEAEKD